MFYKIITLLIYIVMFIPLVLIGIIFIVLSAAMPSKITTFGRIAGISIATLLFARIKIKGEIPQDRPLILMFNHSSFIDAFSFAYCVRGKTTAIAANEIYQYPIFGWMLKKYKAIPIDRKNIASAKKSIEKGQKALKEGYNVVILPEGTRTINGKIRKFRKGGFHMAININAPILPIGSKGAYEFKPKNRWYIKPGTITLNIGEIIEPEEFESLGIDGLSDKVREQFKNLTNYELES